MGGRGSSTTSPAKSDARRPRFQPTGMLGTDSDSYGRQRVFGTLACGLTSFLTGLLVSQTGNLYYPFIIRFCAMSIVVGLLAKVPNYWRRPDQVETFALKEPPKAVTAGAALQHRPSLASTDSSMFSVFDPSLTTSPAVMSSPANPLHGSSFLGDMPGDLRKSALTKGMDRRSEIIAKTATVAETVPAKPASASPPSRKCTGPASLGWLLNINVITFLFSVSLKNQSSVFSWPSRSLKLKPPTHTDALHRSHARRDQHL